MKRYGNFYDKIYDISNVRLAIIKASKGKKNRAYVKKILNNIDYYALEINQMLKHNKYKPSPYKQSVIFDGSNKKERIIHKPVFYPDQVIHWALMLQLEPIIKKGMYSHCCGSVPGKGSSWGQKYIERWIRNDTKNTKYCLKLDIKKFYQSIDKEDLKRCFIKKIKDEKVLNLIFLIIDSCDNGLPIGNYTSQWFANFTLQDLDHYIKEKLKVKYYIRYIDDMVLLGSNKKKLHRAKLSIENMLSKKSLTIKKNWQIFKTNDRGVDFLGFRFFSDRTILRKRNALRIKRRIKRISKKPEPTIKDSNAMISYWGWIKRSNSYKFYNINFIKFRIKYFKLIISLQNKKKGVG